MTTRFDISPSGGRLIQETANAASGTKSESPRSSDKPPLVVMIVDSDPHVRELAGYFLAEAGYQVEYALDGYEALDKAKKAPPDVILLELILPRLNGLALCRLLKTGSETRNIRVVVLSVLMSLNRAQTAGADAFLSKPLEKTRLLDAILKVVSL